jgi:DNA processing protein
VIVSGLARGIDGVAHEAALATGTVAVVAGGIDVIYPPEHEDLTRRIAEAGCIVSEMPPGFVPRAKDFPRRNRIISGISLGVLVVEAARRSGTLVTARLAVELGREVFAIPGHPLDPRAEGTNQLLKQGAVIATEPADVLCVLQPMMAAPYRHEAMEDASEVPTFAEAPEPSSSDRAKVLSALGPQPCDVDEIGRVSGLSARAVRLVLVELDLAGRIERHGQHLVSLLGDLPTE